MLRIGAWLAISLCFCSGCANLGDRRGFVAPTRVCGVEEAFQNKGQPTTGVMHATFAPASVEQSGLGDATLSAITGAQELAFDPFIQLVLVRNPSLAQMAAAWEAANARYPQATSLEDPMFGATVGPASIGSKEVDFGYRLEASQKLPYCGKRSLRGQNAAAEAAAAGNELDDMRLQLVEAARFAFFDYYLVHRALAVNAEALNLLRELRGTAEDRFKANQVPQQDLLQADVEIGRLRERSLMLERMRKVTQARINTLMHLPPDSSLPPPPAKLDLGVTPPAAVDLRAQAVARRPDLQALANRIAAERAALGLAYKEYYPDFEVMAAYDAFWQPSEKDLRPMIGVRLNLPVQTDRRRGAVAEAEAKLAGRVAELAARTDQVYLQVQEAYEQVLESEKAVRLYADTILPSATRNVEAARAAYVANRIPFLSLIEAQRNLIELRDRYYESITEYHRRRATLERVVGAPLTVP
jgi:outer membrane protein TolC